jgi:integrase
VPIDRLDAALLETYKAKRGGLKVTPATINKGLRAVKYMAGVAVGSAWGWMDRGRLAELREVGQLKEPQDERPIKPVELAAIPGAFKRVDSRFARRVVQAALMTGCRLGEILALTDPDVDLKRRVIDLSKTNKIDTTRSWSHRRWPPCSKRRWPSQHGRGGAVFVNGAGKVYTVDGFPKHFAQMAERVKVTVNRSNFPQKRTQRSRCAARP